MSREVIDRSPDTGYGGFYSEDAATVRKDPDVQESLFAEPVVDPSRSPNSEAPLDKDTELHSPLTQ